MPTNRKNRFDVQVVFPDIAFGIKNRTDVELTPEIVADELEAFCRRIRNGGKVPPSADGERARQQTTERESMASPTSGYPYREETEPLLVGWGDKREKAD